MYKATIKNQIFIVRLAKIHLWIVLILFFTFSLPFLLSSLDLNFSTKFYDFTTKTWKSNSTLHLIYTLGPLTQVLCFNFSFVYWILSYLKSQWIQFRTRSIFIILTILVSEFIVELLKRIFSRPRPRNIEFFGGENHFASQLGIAENKVLFQQSSQDKLNFIQKLQSKGRLVLMLGDGWNDAPALTQADLSLTLTSGTDATLEAADIILLTPDLNRLLLLFKISQSTLKLVRQNIIISLVYNFIAIPLAIFGLVIPLVAALSMSLSSLLVVGNSFLHFQSLQDK